MKRKGTTKNIGRKDSHDRFYTSPDEARRLVSFLIEQHPECCGKDIVFVEPSAGCGSFTKAVEEAGLAVLSYDIAPAAEPVCSTPIVKADFLALTREKLIEDAGFENPSFVFIGNPPFGVQGDLSIAFINHCFELGASAVYFILPPTFRKESYLAKLPHAEISTVIELQDTAYLLPSGEKVDVPSCFIGFSYVESKPAPKDTSELLESLPFEFCPKAESSFSIRRVGGTAGLASTNMDLSENSNYFCRLKADCSEWTLKSAIAAINELEFPERDWTVGPRSVSKRELASRWIEKHGK